MELILLALAFLLGGFGVELLLLHVTSTKGKWLRALPLLAVAGLWILAWQDYHRPGMFIGLREIVVFADIAAGFLVLAGWGLAWPVFRRWKR